MRESRTNHISYETLLNRIMDCFYETGIITASRVMAKRFWISMCRICEDELLHKLDADVEDVEKAIGLILQALQEEYKLEYAVSKINDYIKGSGLTYAEEFDKICLIVDRDRESFISTPEHNQYVYVVEKCEEKGFGLYVTNPCFEFWLLLHFDDVFELDRDKVLENPKVTAKRRYVEQELRKIWPGYKKSFYHAEILAEEIDKAIRNEKKFCEDVRKLETSIGSNIGKLIEEMRMEGIKFESSFQSTDWCSTAGEARGMQGYKHECADHCIKERTV